MVFNFSVARKALYTLAVLGLLSSNILTITNAKFYDTLSDFFSRIPLSDLMANSKSSKYKTMAAENNSLKKQNEVFKQKERVREVKIAKANKISKRVALRTAKNVSLNVSSVVAESIPYVGIVAVIAVTAADIYAGCETIKDTNELLTLFGADDLSTEQTNVCGMKVPTENEVREKLENYKREIDDAIGGTIYEIFN